MQGVDSNCKVAGILSIFWLVECTDGGSLWRKKRSCCGSNRFSRSSKMPLRVLPKCIPQLRVPNQPPKKRLGNAQSHATNVDTVLGMLLAMEGAKEMIFICTLCNVA